jgi:hypothetical protein
MESNAFVFLRKCYYHNLALHLVGIIYTECSAFRHPSTCGFLCVPISISRKLRYMRFIKQIYLPKTLLRICEGVTAVEKQSEPRPTAFIEDKNFSLDLYRKDRGVWWHMSEATTIKSTFQTIKYLPDESPVRIVALYKKQLIGQGEYYKRGPAGRLERIETIKTEAAMMDVIERAFQDYTEEQPSLEELARSYPCDWPGCSRLVNGAAVVRTLRLQIDDQSVQERSFYSCAQHAEALKRATALSISLAIGTPGRLRRSKSRSVDFR